MVNNIDKVFAFFGIYILVGKQTHEHQMILDIRELNYNYVIRCLKLNAVSCK